MEHQKEITVAKIAIRDSSIYIKVIWSPRSFHITVFTTKECWSGVLSEELVEEYSSDCKETCENYIQTLKCVLTVQNDDYVYDFPDLSLEQSGWIKFIVNKKFGDGTVFKYCLVKLSKNTNYDKDFLLDLLINENSELKKNIEEYVDRNNKLSSELGECRSAMEKYVKSTKDTSSNLYGKFSQLLNAKKRRIEILEDTNV